MKKKQNQHKEYIAFEGVKYTIEWYFDEKGKSISLNYLESLNDKEQIKLFELIKLIGVRGEIKNKTKFRNEGDKIYAFKPQPHRFLCFFFEGKKIIVQMDFIKRQTSFQRKRRIGH